MKNLTFLTFLLILSLSGIAREFPEPMKPARMVNDLTGLFNPQQANALEQKLRNFNDTSSTQIAIVTVPSIYNYAPNDYAQRLAEEWGIGKQGKDNGILILVKPKSQKEKGQVAIAVGYGLEGVVPDAIASRIIRNEILPRFQQGNYYAGIDKATDILIKLSAGEFTADQYAGQGSDSDIWIIIPFLVAFLVPLLMRKRKGYTTGSHGNNGFPPIFFGGSGRGSSFGSFNSGGGSFGGFGGGSFGGGGASGSW